MDDTLERIVKCIGPKHGAKKQLAEYLGIHPNVITNWLNGRNRSYRRYLDEIAQYFNVSVAYLKGDTDKKNPAPEIRDGKGKNLVRTIRHDGSYSGRWLTDEQLEALRAIINQMPDVEDDF